MRPRFSLVVNGKTLPVFTGDTPGEAVPSVANRDGGAGDHVPRLQNTSRTRPLLGEGVARPGPGPSPLSALKTAKRAGTLLSVTPLGGAVIEVVVTISRALSVLPGQHVEATFPGHEGRLLCPTQRIEGTTELNELVFHLRRDTTLGAAVAAIAAGGAQVEHAVRVRGPAGGSPYRTGRGRLVLVASETGFAPIWAIARAARYQESSREIVVVAGARDAGDLYMRPAFDWLRATGVQRLVLAASRERISAADVRPGPITAHLPPLRPDDSVYAAGAPEIVRAVGMLCESAGATCIGIPFLRSRSRARRLVAPGPEEAQFGL
ncbi:oxidoreductase [uncultured Methylobacterium sp.]|jgi:CDP-4-dehydro-6-deoxyglucose reductase|uniref:oxidoreductase n=1 Tax=uncultured Methylobacterium sp. TaxID=157278 RepID=UPI00261EB06B|nr:oxidoreductase [uncultured Methylobacterium sp.]